MSRNTLCIIATSIFLMGVSPPVSAQNNIVDEPKTLIRAIYAGLYGLHDTTHFTEAEEIFLYNVPNRYDIQSKGLFKYEYKKTMMKNQEIIDSGGICIDFDTFIGGQDYDKAELAKTIRFESEMYDDNKAVVRVNLETFGEPWDVEWFLIQENGLWHVFDKYLINMALLYSELCETESTSYGDKSKSITPEELIRFIYSGYYDDHGIDITQEEIDYSEEFLYAYRNNEYGIFKYGYERTLKINEEIFESGDFCLDFDTAIGGQDHDPEEFRRTISFQSHLHDENTASVTVELETFGEPWKVHWFLTKEEGLWYVYDKELVNMGILFSELCD